MMIIFIFFVFRHYIFYDHYHDDNVNQEGQEDYLMVMIKK